MTTSLGAALGFSAAPSELTTHANTVNQVSSQVGQAGTTASQSVLGGQAFGQISVALAFANLIKAAATPGMSALSQAQSTMSLLSKTVGTTATNYTNTEQSNAGRFLSSGLTGTTGTATTTTTAIGTTAVKPTTNNNGANLLTDVSGLEQGISSGSWIQAGLSGMKVVSDVGSILSNPVGAVTSFGLNFLVQHVQPLQQAVGWLVGSPAQVAAYGSSWQNAAKLVTDAGNIYSKTVAQDTANWTGAAASGYKTVAADKANTLQALATATKAVGSATQAVGQLVSQVQQLIQSLVSKAMQQIIQTALAASFTITIPVVVARVVQEVASWMSKIATVIKQLTSAFNTLVPLLSGVTQLFGKASTSLASGVQPLATLPTTTVPGISMPTPVGRVTPLPTR